MRRDFRSHTFFQDDKRLLIGSRIVGRTVLGYGRVDRKDEWQLTIFLSCEDMKMQFDCILVFTC